VWCVGEGKKRRAALARKHEAQGKRGVPACVGLGFTSPFLVGLSSFFLLIAFPFLSTFFF
jgi:hypothetical protein